MMGLFEALDSQRQTALVSMLLETGSRDTVGFIEGLQSKR